MRIGVDLMGSESPPAVLFEAVVLAARELPETTFIVFATPYAIESIRAEPGFSQIPSSILFHVVSDTIEMSDEPLAAIRQKKNSSLVVGLRFLKKRSLDGFVSAGNTGSLIAAATLSLPRLPGVRRPALLATLPTKTGEVAVIDVGGNVSCKADHLVHYALMGAAYQRCYQGIAHPKVGLLNIGIESKKGTSAVREAYQMLKEMSSSLHFIGNIEGREVFEGKADVLVTDGFTGNILLKTSEGVSFFLIEQLHHVLKGLTVEQREGIFRDLRYQFDYEEYGGAIICGVDCVAIKCHGKSSVKGILNGIKGAASLVQNGFIQQIKAAMQATMIDE